VWCLAWWEVLPKPTILGCCKNKNDVPDDLLCCLTRTNVFPSNPADHFGDVFVVGRCRSQEDWSHSTENKGIGWYIRVPSKPSNISDAALALLDAPVEAVENYCHAPVSAWSSLISWKYQTVVYCVMVGIILMKKHAQLMHTLSSLLFSYLRSAEQVLHSLQS